MKMSGGKEQGLTSKAPAKPKMMPESGDIQGAVMPTVKSKKMPAATTPKSPMDRAFAGRKF